MVINLNNVPLHAYKQLELKKKKEPVFHSKTIIEASQGNIKLPSKLLNEISLKLGSFETIIKVKNFNPLTLECRIKEGEK